MPSHHTWAKDFKEAKIERVDASGRKVDFHALRHTFATNLAKAGVPALSRWSCCVMVISG